MTSTIVLWDEEHPEKTLTIAQLVKMQFARLKGYCQVESRLMQLSPGGFTGTRSPTLHQPTTSKGLFLGFQGIRESTKVIIQGYFLVTFLRFGSDPVAPSGWDIRVELSAPESAHREGFGQKSIPDVWAATCLITCCISNELGI
jgi:hypothetical protein